MGKVYRSDRKSVQRIKAREIVPGDVVEVSGKIHKTVQTLNDCHRAADVIFRVTGCSYLM